MADIKNTITNIVAFVVALGTIIASALGQVPDGAKWYIWVGAVCIAVIGWFTGKSADGKAKKLS
jgi:hypothetical protein